MNWEELTIFVTKINVKIQLFYFEYMHRCNFTTVKIQFFYFEYAQMQFYHRQNLFWVCTDAILPPSKSNFSILSIHRCNFTTVYIGNINGKDPSYEVAMAHWWYNIVDAHA